MVADIMKDAERITLKNMERGKYFRIYRRNRHCFLPTVFTKYSR